MWWWISAGLIALTILVAVLALLIGAKKSAKTGIPIANSSRITRLPAYRRALGKYQGRAWALAALLLMAIGFTAIGAGRWVHQKVEIPEKFSRDIVLCLDVSGSMKRYDAEVIDTYQQLLQDFKGDRIAMFIWNSTTVQVFPLTDDYRFVRGELEAAKKAMTSPNEPRRYDDLLYFKGTWENKRASSLIGDGLASCTFAFDTAGDQHRSRSIILATDNEVGNGTETISLADATKLAKSKNIKVYGLNTSTKKPDKVAEYKAAMAAHGGQYYDISDKSAVPKIVDQISQDQTAQIKGAAEVFIVDRPEFWLVAALIAFAVFLLAAWRFKL